MPSRPFTRLLLILTLAAMSGCARNVGSSSGNLTDVVGLSAGYYDSCAIQYGGRLACWGNTVTGQGGFALLDECEILGLPILCSKRAGTIIGGGVLASTVGLAHSCYIIDGAALCWGEGSFGQLGDGLGELSYEPVAVQGLDDSVTSIEAGYSHSCAVQNGGAFCWGENTDGQLGDSTNTDSLTPVAVTGLAAGVSEVSAGGSTSCALLANGSVVCWGANTTGQLGDGTMVASSNVPVVAVAANATAVASAVGLTPGHSCAIVNGAAKCWGLNLFGQLGDGTILPRNTPTTVLGLTSGVTAIATGGAHTCAIVNGGLKCWGLNNSGQLGAGSTSLCLGGTTVYPCQLTPVSVTGLDRTIATNDQGVVGIALGFEHSCAIVDDQTVKCWGDNLSGQLGIGNLTPSLSPVTVLK